jgi:hypothetical protein
LQDGKLYFAVRSAEQLTVISSSEPLPESTHTVTAKLAKDANMTLAADDKQLAAGKAPMLMGVQPKDGLQVGRDKNGAVGEYTSPFAYRGEIKGVKIEFASE